MVSCGGDTPGWEGIPAWSSTLDAGLLHSRGAGPGCRGLASGGGRAAPQPGLPGCVCVHTCVWVCGCVHICMHGCVHMCLCVCVRVCVAGAGQLGASCLRTLWMLGGGGAGPAPRQAWDKIQRAHPCSGHPSPLQAGIRLEGTAGATGTPSQGPLVQGLWCSRTPGQPRPSQGRAPHPKRLLLLQLCVLASSRGVEGGGGC